MVNSMLNHWRVDMTYRSALLGASVLMIAVPAFAGSTPPSYVPDLLPPNPVAGECYGRVEIPARYESTTEQVITRDEHQRVMVQQPQLQTTTERVLVKEPSVRYIVRQPTYGTVTQQVMTRPGYDRLTVSEPQFQTVTETVARGEARLVWKRGNPARLRAQGYTIHSTADAGPSGRGYSSTVSQGLHGGQNCGNVCEIWCLVEEPGESVTVTRQALVNAGQVHRTPVQPQYQTISKQVVTDPGGVQQVQVPGEYRNLQVEKLVRPGAVATVNVPAEYGAAHGRRVVSESRYEWRRIECHPQTQPRVHRQSTGHHQTRPYIAPQPLAAQHSQPITHARAARGVTIYPSAQTSTTVRQQQHYTGARIAPSGNHAVTTPLQGTLTQTGPAYTSSYQSPYALQGGSYSARQNGMAAQISSGSPDRAYSGPAYANPETINPRSGRIERYESSHSPNRTRRR
jgi:hypothetical protein